MPEPLVTVCMPVHNAAPYLSEAIRSISSQTVTELLLLVFDDASTDASLAIAERHAQRDSRIQVAARSRQGYTRHLNEGLDRAQTPFFARMDADDIVTPDRLERQLAFLQANPDCWAVGTQAILVDEQDWPIAKTAHPLDHQGIDASLLRGQIPLVDPSLVMQTERIRQTGGYDPAFEPAEGFEFLLRLCEQGRVANVPEHLYRYRMHAGQVTVARYERQQEAMREALEASRARRGGRAVPPGPYVHRRTSLAWQTHVVWAEEALRFGYRRSAIKHSRLAVTRRPWSRTAWRVLLRALAPSSPSSPGPRSAAT